MNKLHRESEITSISPVVLMAGAADEISSAVDSSRLALQNWVEQRDYAGHEPFDILSSPLLQCRWARRWPFAIPFIHFGKPFAWLGVRRSVRVPDTQNRPALGLFLSTYCDFA